MPGSHGGSPRRKSAGADREKLAEWEARTFGALRRHRDLVTVVDDELPDDPLRDLDETRSALERIARA